MPSTPPIIKRVDHIIIRINDPAYDQLVSLLTETFQLPMAWPVTPYPSFKSGGIFAGNVNLEILNVGSLQKVSSSKASQAQLYGFAFEPYPLAESVPALAQRAIPHLPPIPYIETGADGKKVTLYTNVFLGKLLGSNLWMSTFFFLGRVLPQKMWTRGNTSSSTALVNIVFDKVYRHGMLFLCEYNRQVYNVDQARVENSATLRAQQVGWLGLESMKEIIVGVRNFEAAQKRWQKLFTPALPTSPGVWLIGDGPSVHLVPHSRDGMLALVWRVTSLERAKKFLIEKGMLGEVSEQQITIAPAKIYGLDIRLVE